MSLFAIADLHLSFGADKPMDVFPGWKNYTQRLSDNWRKNVSAQDTVVIAGDISWAMNLSEAVRDFEFIHNLPGEKIILKGNHDYWFQTKKKTEDFLLEHSFTSIKMLFNNAYSRCGVAICGTRGWMNEKGESPDKKILLREAGRLSLSVNEAKKAGGEPIVFLHYPPVYENDSCAELEQVLVKNGIKRCYYGHLHGASCKNAVTGVKNGVDYRLVSCDYIQFNPVKVI